MTSAVGTDPGASSIGENWVICALQQPSLWAWRPFAKCMSAAMTCPRNARWRATCCSSCVESGRLVLSKAAPVNAAYLAAPWLVRVHGDFGSTKPRHYVAQAVEL